MESGTRRNVLPSQALFPIVGFKMDALRQQTALTLTALAGAAGVALGAFGAHGLEDFLLAQDRLDTWETAVFYHLVHVGVMLVLVLRKKWIPLTWTLLALGVLIFSGSLYVLCLTQTGWLGAITPIGGLLLIAGWLNLIRMKA